MRRAKLAALREQAGGAAVFPNDFSPNAAFAELHESFASLDGEAVEAQSETYRVAGRVMAVRSFGKSAFVSVRDGGATLQWFASKAELGENYATVKALDAGDIVAAEGGLFRTRTGELTLRASSLRLLSKGLQPLPEKWHGLSDVEMRYRRRYVDLIVNEDVRKTFRDRARIVTGIRKFLDARGFLEVETPMMQHIAGGAAARPFVTHHNALSLDMYLRVAPELYLKRLVVGGFERVFELNRNFRNEGISTEHNPEFTMCEFYQAYATYDDLMAMTEEMLSSLARDVNDGSTKATYGDFELDFSAPFDRVTMAEAVAEHSPLSAAEAEDVAALESYADSLGLDKEHRKAGLGLLADVFEEVAEEKLVQPTFVTRFPVEVSPLARANDADPRFVDRFELYIAGKEVANGFSELNDPVEQRARFDEQLRLREAGDDEAHMMDEDFIRALEYGMPPTAGEGIGIDRLVMVLTGCTSIREVILFPQLRPERRG